MSKALLKYVQVDAFSRSAFRGRPIAVCFPPTPLDEQARKVFAREVGATEAVFVRGDGDQYLLEREGAVGTAYVSAAFAAAHVIWTEGQAGHLKRLIFNAPGQTLTAAKRADHVTVDVASPGLAPLADGAGILRLSGVRYAGVAGSQLLVELSSESHVAIAEPSLPLLTEGPYERLILTARSGSTLRDFVSRTFERSRGFSEAAVSGTAHTVLAPYWLDELATEKVTGEQLGERGGFVHGERSGLPGRVLLAGQAITTLKGILLVNPE